MPRKPLQPILWTFALCALPWFAAGHPYSWLLSQPTLAGFVKPLPFLLLASLAFLAAKLNQTRLTFVALSLAAMYLLLQTSAAPGFLPAQGWARTQTVGLAVPMAFSLLFLLPEGNVRSGRGALLAAAALIPIWLVGYCFLSRWPWMENLVRWEAVSPGSPLRLPEATALFASSFALSAFLHRNPSRRLLHVFLGISLVPLYAALNFRSAAGVIPQGSVVTALAFSCQALVLVYGVFLLYWERVYLDELTGVPNRRALNEQLPRLPKKYVVAMMDIDHFKRFNDTYGHEQGDHALRFVAAHLEAFTGGRVYRYGGEEFTALFEDVEIQEAAQILDRARQTLADRVFTIRAPRKVPAKPEPQKRKPGGNGSRSQVHITLSVGVAAAQAGETPEETVEAADRALYQAKDEGRNCVVLHSSDQPKRRRAKVK